MRLTKDIWISGRYYIDFDVFGQFRIIGPKNLLYFGLVDLPRNQFSIDRIQSSQGGIQLSMQGKFTGPALLYLPVMGDMRTIREVLMGLVTVALRFFIVCNRKNFIT